MDALENLIAELEYEAGLIERQEAYADEIAEYSDGDVTEY